MALAQPSFPMRAIIRCKAKQYLLHDAEFAESCITFNESLLKEVTATVFQSPRYEALYRICRTQADSAIVEDEMAAEVAEAYKRIEVQQSFPLVQQLNALLDG